jgi:hypothetical protein
MTSQKTRVATAALLLALLLPALLPSALARSTSYIMDDEQPPKESKQIMPIPIMPTPTPLPPPPAPSPPVAPPATPTPPPRPSRPPFPLKDPVEWLVEQAKELLKPRLPPEPQPPPPPVSPYRPYEVVQGVKATVKVLADSEEFVRKVLMKEGFDVRGGTTIRVRAGSKLSESVEGFKKKLKSDGKLWNELSNLFGGEGKLERFLDSLKNGFERRYDALVREGGALYRAELKAAQDLAVNARYAVEEAIKDAVVQDVGGVPVKWYINTGMRPYLSSSLQGSFSKARDLIVRLLTKLGILYHETSSSAVGQVLGEVVKYRLKQYGIDKFLREAAGVVVVVVEDLMLELHVVERSPMPRAYCVSFGDIIACFDENGNPVKPEKVRFGGIS